MSDDERLRPMIDDDDPLLPLMKAIDPARIPADTPLTEREREVLARIMRGPGAPAPSGRVRAPVRPWHGRRVRLGAMIAAVLILLIAATPLAFPLSSAVARTPAPLSYTHMDLTPMEVLDVALEQLLTDLDRSQPVRAADYTGWYAQIDHEETGEAVEVVISPQVVSLRWADDLSGRLLVTAGEPYWADGSPQPVPAGDAPEAGSVLSEALFAPGEFSVPTPDEPGRTRDELRDYLSRLGLPGDAGSFLLMDALKALMSFWTLTDEQHAALLTLILSRDDVLVEGRTTDRLGRPVVGITASSEPAAGMKNTLLISESTGRIIGLETTRTTAYGVLPAGAVVGYTLWEDE